MRLKGRNLDMLFYRCKESFEMITPYSVRKTDLQEKSIK